MKTLRNYLPAAMAATLLALGAACQVRDIKQLGFVIDSNTTSHPEDTLSAASTDTQSESMSATNTASESTTQDTVSGTESLTAQTDSPTNSSTGSATTSDSDTQTDTGLALPNGCERLSPANENGFGWTGAWGIHSGKVVWRWLDDTAGATQGVLMSRDLASKVSSELLRRTYPEEINNPVVYGSQVLFESTKEIFELKFGNTIPKQLTSNDRADAGARGGQTHFSFISMTAGGLPNESIRIQHASTGDYTELCSDGACALTLDFDGKRWVFFQRTDDKLYKYDLDHPELGEQVLYDQPVELLLYRFDPETGRLVTGLLDTAVNSNFDLWLWDMETGTHTVLSSEPFDQGLPGFHKNLLGYVDTQKAESKWYGFYQGEVMVMDVDTGVRRVVIEGVDQYFGLGLWDHWLAVNNVGRWGDSILVCDLKAAGIVGEDGHVIAQ